MGFIGLVSKKQGLLHYSTERRIMVKLLFLTILGCLLACNVLAETKKSENENRQMSLADMMNEFKNSYSANRGKRDIVEEEEIEDDEITEDEFDELMGRYFNPNGFFFQPGKRSNPNSMIFMPKRSNPNSMIFMPKRADDVAKRETDLDEFF